MTPHTASATHPAGPANTTRLSAEQQAVVDHGAGALLVFAGPGSGKTRTLTARIAALLAGRRARARQILALTFTVRAAEEMRVRLTAAIGSDAAGDVTVATFHALGARILRENATAFGRSPAYSIYDADDVLRVIRAGLGDGEPADEPADDLAKEALAQITLAKSRLWSPKDLRDRAEHPDCARIAAIWEHMESELRASNAFDFADLVTKSVALLTRDPAVRGRYRRRWRHIVVDEFQDTDRAQFVLLERLAGPGGGGPQGSLVVAGDDDQVLYRWRGADVENLLDFRRAYPCAAELVLRRNYRSRPEILAVASRCIAYNARRRAKDLVADRAPGGRVWIARFACDRHEAAGLTRAIAAEIARGTDPREILALCRSLRFTVPLQHALSSAGIAYRIIGAHSLWERVEVLDALAYVTLVSNPYDTVAFRRAVSAPSDRRQFSKAKHPALSRGVGDVTAQAVIRYARSAGIDLLEACATAGERGAADHGLVASPTARASLALFGEQLGGVRREHQRTGQLAKAVIATLTIADGPVDCYDDLLKHTDDAAVAADCARVKEDLRSLCRAAHTYEQRHGHRGSLVGFLEQTRVEPAATLTAEQDERLTISTIHGAKGTEARVVLVIGCEEGLLPIAYALESGDALRVEEERRLFYVAATRGKDRVTFTTSAERLGRPTKGPSRFLAEAGM